jgi:branched-subunit amino acid transport protein
MMRAEIIITILGMALVTFFTRFASPALLGSAGVASWLRRLLKHVPTAILTALIAPALFAPQGHIELTASNHYLLAGLVAAFFAYRRQPPIVTMGMGMAVMLMLRSFGG